MRLKITALTSTLLAVLLLFAGCSIFRATGQTVSAVGRGAGTAVEGIGSGAEQAVGGTGRAISGAATGTERELRK